MVISNLISGSRKSSLSKFLSSIFKILHMMKVGKLNKDLSDGVAVEGIRVYGVRSLEFLS